MSQRTISIRKSLLESAAQISKHLDFLLKWVWGDETVENELPVIEIGGIKDR